MFFISPGLLFPPPPLSPRLFPDLDSFNIYDLNGDGYISREEIFQMMKTCFIQQEPTEEDPEEGVKDLVEMVAKKMVCACSVHT